MITSASSIASSNSSEHPCAELLRRHRHHRSRSGDRDLRAHLRQQVDVRAHDPAVLDVADDRDLESCERPFVLPDREGVEQRLGGVLVGAVPGVDHARIEALRQHVGGTSVGAANDDQIGLHRLQVERRIDQRLALGERRSRDREVDVVGRQPLLGDLEARPRAGRRLEEQIDDRLAAQRRHLLDRPSRHLAEALGRVQNQRNLVCREARDPEKVLAGPLGAVCHSSTAALSPAESNGRTSTPSTPSIASKRTRTCSPATVTTPLPTMSG